MKKLILFFIITGIIYSQDLTYKIGETNVYSDTLTATVDTIDLRFKKDTEIKTLTVYTTSGTDTMRVFVYDDNGIYEATHIWSERAGISQQDGKPYMPVIATTTPKEYQIMGSAIGLIRLRTDDISASLVFRIVGKNGEEVFSNIGDTTFYAKIAENTDTSAAGNTLLKVVRDALNVIDDWDDGADRANTNAALEVAGSPVSNSNPVPVTGGSIPNADFISPSHFTATYTSSSTITLASLPIAITNSTQIRYILQVSGTDSSNIYINGANGVTFGYSAGVLTIYGSGTPFTATDTYQVGLNGVKLGDDLSLDLKKTQEQSPLSAHRVTKETLEDSTTAADTLTTTLVDVGSEVSTATYNVINFYVTLSINSSSNVRFKVLAKHTSAGSEEYALSSAFVNISTRATYIDTASYRYFEIDDDANQLFIISVDVNNTIEYLQLQACVGTLGATPNASLTKVYTIKAWR